VPRLFARYPFLVGETPGDLPGLDELEALREAGAALVATADPIHHGAGYGTPAADRLSREATETSALARAQIAEGYARLARRDFVGFLDHAARVKSDFRDPGPILATLLGDFAFEVVGLELVDYARALGAEEPTWVAGALVRLEAVAPRP
jgi:hypothetical protein